MIVRPEDETKTPRIVINLQSTPHLIRMQSGASV